MDAQKTIAIKWFVSSGNILVFISSPKGGGLRWGFTVWALSAIPKPSPLSPPLGRGISYPLGDGRPDLLNRVFPGHHANMAAAWIKDLRMPHLRL